MNKRVGIFSGTFDPVHKGHIAFALEAMRQSGLETVYFLPEQQPRHKVEVTHYAHRVAMLKLALKPYKNLHVLELPDRCFDVAKTLPRLTKRLGDDLYMLLGSDTFRYLAEYGWPNADLLLQKTKLIVGARLGEPVEMLEELTGLLPDESNVMILQAGVNYAASSDIRSALRRGKEHTAHLSSLTGYIKEHWLYVAVPAASEAV
jgi:nicotinate-nucleotide adenylyltransferase